MVEKHPVQWARSGQGQDYHGRACRGQKYRGPSGELIPNQGQQKVPVKTETGQKRALTFQSAPVRKPLMAVSGACDRDQFVLFDNDGSFVINRDSAE